MGCEWLKHEDGTVVHINRGRSGGKPKPCPFCKHGAVSKLCDFKNPDGSTCDAGICDRCATNKGLQYTDVGGGFKRLNDTVDLCPNHKGTQ